MSNSKESGNRYFSERKFEQALSCYSKAIAEKPSAPTLYTNRALCCMKMGMWTQVVEDCQKAVQLQSSTIKAHFLMGKALVELQKYDDALASLHTAHELAKKQQKNFGEDITCAIRIAKRKKWNCTEERRLKQESELRAHLAKLLTEDRDRKISSLDVTSSAEETEFEVKRLHDDCENKLSQLNSVFEKADETQMNREVPDYLCGKISFDLMTDPYITPSGITYDHKDIEDHLQRVGHFDPVTRQELTQDQLIPNLAMKEVIDDFVSKHEWVEQY